MNEADKIRVKRLEDNVDSLERENKALRKELFKYKLKDGDVEEDTSGQDILEKIRARNVAYNFNETKTRKMGRDIYEEFQKMARIK